MLNNQISNFKLQISNVGTPEFSSLQPLSSEQQSPFEGGRGMCFHLNYTVHLSVLLHVLSVSMFIFLTFAPLTSYIFKCQKPY